MEERDGGLWFLVRNRYIWSSSTVPGSELPNHWHLSDGSHKGVFCYIWIGLAASGASAVIRGWHFHSHPPTLGMPEGQEHESTATGKWFSNVCIMESQKQTKNPKRTRFRSFWIGEHMEISRLWWAQRGHESSVPSTHILPYTCLISGCFWFIFFSNKPVI